VRFVSPESQPFTVTMDWWPVGPYFAPYAVSMFARNSLAPTPTSTTSTSIVRPGTRMRASGTAVTCPNQPVVRRYQVRTYTPTSAQTTQIGTDGRSVPSTRRLAI
jgi:hypothetical protein